MTRRSGRDRDLIDVPIALRRGPSLTSAIDIVERFVDTHDTLPREVLAAFGQGQHTRGWEAGQRDLLDD